MATTDDGTVDLTGIYNPAGTPSQTDAQKSSPQDKAGETVDLTGIYNSKPDETGQNQGGQATETHDKFGKPYEMREAAPRSTWESLKDTVRNSAIGHALESGMPKAADALGLRPTETIYSPEYEQHKQQLISPEEAISPNTQNVPSRVTRGVLGLAGGFTTPENLAIMFGTGGLGLLGEAAPTVSRLISAGFSYQMLKGAVQQYPELKEAINKGDYGQAAETLTKMLGSAAIATQGVRHAAGDLVGNEPGTIAPDQATLDRADKAKLPSMIPPLSDKVKETALAPVRAAYRGLSAVQTVLPTAIGMGVGELVGHPYWGAIAGRFMLPQHVLDSFLEKGRTAGQSTEAANVSELERDHAKAASEQQVAQRAYDKHRAGQEKGIPAPKPVLDAKTKADEHLALISDHLKAAKEAAEAAKSATPSAPDQEITPSAVAAARPMVPPAQPEVSPAHAATTIPQEPQEAPQAFTGMHKLGPTGEAGTMGKPLALPEHATETAPAPPEVPQATEVRPLAPPAPATAAEMAGLKAVGGKVVEAPEKAVGPLIKQGLAEGSKAAKPEAAPVEAPKPVEVKAEAPKEAPERSPEDLTKVDTVVKELPNQDLIRHGSRFGVDESKYDFSKREATREGGSKHPVEREAHANATVAALPEALKNHIVDAANAWDAKDPSVFDQASRSNESRAERARAIMGEAMKRYQDELASKGVSGGSGAPDKKAPKKLPSGDDLIKKYGESSGDPADVTFILKDGRAVANTGIDHDIMLGGKATDAQPPREQFVQEGNIRVRPRQGTIGGREVSISIPPSGINPEQLAYIKKMSPQLRSGAVLIENGERGGDYKVIEHGKATNEALESAINDLGPKGNRLVNLPAGTEEGAKQDTDHFAQAKKELPNGSLSEQLGRAQELKAKAYKDMTPAEQEALAAKGQSGGSGAAAAPAKELPELAFNPDKFRTQTGEDTELRPLGKKKNPLGKAKK